MTILYKGEKLSVRGGAWCDVMNRCFFHELELAVADDNKTGKYDICVDCDGVKFAIRTY